MKGCAAASASSMAADRSREPSSTNRMSTSASARICSRRPISLLRRASMHPSSLNTGTTTVSSGLPGSMRLSPIDSRRTIDPGLHGEALGIEPLLLKSLQALKYANGAYLIAVCAAAGILLASRSGKSPARLPIDVISPAAFYLFCGVALAYAFYPNFSDHAEPAMTSLGIVMLKGKPLYPGLDEYSFHGLLYGPLLAEIQAAAIFLGTAIAGLPVLLASKLAGVLAFFLASGVFFKLAPGWGFARAYYTLFLLPFGILAFWNRCEPVFLL